MISITNDQSLNHHIGRQEKPAFILQLVFICVCLETYRSPLGVTLLGVTSGRTEQRPLAQRRLVQRRRCWGVEATTGFFHYCWGDKSVFLSI